MPGRRLTADPPPLIEPMAAEASPPESEQPDPAAYIAEHGETSEVVGESSKGRLTTLLEEERVQFTTLLDCGRVSKEIDVMGHAVVVETLNTDDDLRVGLFTKPYLGTDSWQRAWQLATVSAAIRTIDGRPVYVPLSSEETLESVYREKCAKMARYFPVTITEIYTEVLKLDAEFVELATKLGKLKG